MKKILIDAYTNLNLGDDLFVKILCERYPNVKFYIFSNYSYDLLGLKNLKTYTLNKICKFFNKLIINISNNRYRLERLKYKEIDAIICIGGSLFIENKKYKRIIKGMIEDMKAVKNNYYIIGTNFGPYKEIDYELNYKEVFKKCKDVCFRDNYSYSLFSDLYNVRLAKDIVFSLKNTLKNESIENQYVLISIINPDKKDNLKISSQKYYEKLAKITMELLKINKKVKYISFCKNEGDEDAINEILLKLPKEYQKKVSIYNYDGNIDESLEIISKSEIIIATRFHAMILGFIYEKKVLPIAYSRKTINVLNDLKFSGEYINFSELDKLDIEKVLKSERLELQKLLNAKSNSEKHFRNLDIFLGKKSL